MKSISPIVAALFIAGCAAQPDAPKPEPKDRRETIGWAAADWRLCVDGACDNPTPKTVTLPPSLPPLAPLANAPVKPPAQPVAPQAPIQITALFKFASTAPTEEGQLAIDRAISLLRPSSHVILEGRTDDMGGQGFNDRLAKQRAEFVATRIRQAKGDIPIDIRWQGKCCYAAGNQSEKARASNRRVEIHISTKLKE